MSHADLAADALRRDGHVIAAGIINGHQDATEAFQDLVTMFVEEKYNVHVSSREERDFRTHYVLVNLIALAQRCGQRPPGVNFNSWPYNHAAAVHAVEEAAKAMASAERSKHDGRAFPPKTAAKAWDELRYAMATTDRRDEFLHYWRATCRLLALGAFGSGLNKDQEKDLRENISGAGRANAMTFNRVTLPELGLIALEEGDEPAIRDLLRVVMSAISHKVKATSRHREYLEAMRAFFPPASDNK